MTVVVPYYFYVLLNVYNFPIQTFFFLNRMQMEFILQAIPVVTMK